MKSILTVIAFMVLAPQLKTGNVYVIIAESLLFISLAIDAKKYLA